MTNAMTVRGSLTDRSRKKAMTIAEAIMEVEAIVLVDTSSSMSALASHGTASVSRYDLACKELARVQNDHPGKVAVVSWSDRVEFCPDGIPRYMGNGTAMHRALEYVADADGICRIILISDGEPDSRDETLRVARRFSAGVSTVFVGSEGAAGARFLRELADATGGKYGGARDVLQLGAAIAGLLTAGGER
jgi:hypothetical protein